MTDGSNQTVVLFTVDGERYGLPVDAVREILPCARLTESLRGDSEGRIVLDGRSVTVYALSRMLDGTAPEIGLYTPMIVLRTRPEAWLVDRVEEIRAVESGDWVDGRTQQGVPTKGEVLVGGQTAVVLDPARWATRETVA